jgi:tetratricopeptide (TPR) repeat protein
LQKTVATEVKFVHVVRNPYDNVAATLKRYLVYLRNPALSAIVEDYFALLALGDLYSQWGREEEAIVAYEQVLERDPDSDEAENRLEELRGSPSSWSGGARPSPGLLDSYKWRLRFERAHRLLGRKVKSSNQDGRC